MHIYVHIYKCMCMFKYIYIIVVVQLLSHVWLLWSYGLKHARLPCRSLSPGDCSYSCPLSHWCCLITSSSATIFSFCLQSFPSSESFTMSQLFKLGGQNIGASASASVLPANTLIMIEIEFFFGPIFIIPPNNNSGISTPFIEYSYFPVYLSENSRNFH